MFGIIQETMAGISGGWRANMEIEFLDNSIIKLDNVIYGGSIDREYLLSEESKQIKEEMSKASLVLLDSSLIDCMEELDRLKITNICWLNSKENKWLRKEVKSKNSLHEVAYKGLKLELKKSQVSHGVRVMKSWDKLFLEDKITSFIKPVNMNLSGQLLYLCCGSLAYGIVKIESVESLKNVKESYSLHKTSPIYCKLWWGNSNLYLYKFKTIKKFDKPIQYNYKSGRQHFVMNVDLAKDINTS